MLGLILCYGYVLLVLIGGYVIHHHGEELSRKFIHIMTANWWLIVMVFFEEVWAPLLVSISFLIVNMIAYHYKCLKPIELKQRNPGYGTIYYSLSMIVLTLMSYGYRDLTIGLVGCLVMGYGDGIAALVGKKFPLYSYTIRGNMKSVGGSLTMFMITTAVVLLATYIGQRPTNVTYALMIGVIGMLLEAVARKGRDNLWVPLGCALIYACVS